MISTVTTTTVTTVTTVTSIVSANPMGTFTLVATLALVGYLCTKEVLGPRRDKAGMAISYLYTGVVPLSIAFAVWTILKILSVVRL